MTLRRAGWCTPPEYHHPDYCTCHERSVPQWREWRRLNEARRQRTPRTLESLLPETRR